MANWLLKIYRLIVAKDKEVQQQPIHKAINENGAKVIDPLIK